MSHLFGAVSRFHASHELIRRKRVPHGVGSAVSDPQSLEGWRPAAAPEGAFVYPRRSVTRNLEDRFTGYLGVFALAL